MAIRINVKSSGGSKFQLELPSLTETVAAFKVRLAAECHIPAEAQRLIFRGHVLKDAQTFQEIRDKHGLESGQTMHVVRGSSPAARAAAAAAASTTTTASSTSTAATQTAPSGGGGGGGGATTPGMPPPPSTSPFGPSAFPGGMAAMMQNPEQMQAMLNSPIVDTIMNNPELARNMMMANPQMREIMERNPEVGHVFNDPAIFRQMMQMARNPSLMNEMMRNTDRQMANLEMMPGGFDALRRMQEDIQQPLMDAMQNMHNPTAGTGAAGGGATANGSTATGAGNTAADANPFASLFQQTPSNTPMPNPWAPNNGVPPSTAPHTAAAPTAGSNTTTGTTGGGGGGGGGADARTAHMPDFNSFFGGAGMPMVTPEQMAAAMENPMMQTMLEHMAQNPEALTAIINSNPALRQMADQNPQMAEMMRNPAIMRSMLNPSTIRSLLQLRQLMGGIPGATPAPPSTRSTNTATTNNPGHTDSPSTGHPPTHTPHAPDMASLMAMMNALNGLGGGAGTAAPTNPTPQPELSNEELERMYASQLQQLRDMGFLDTNMCLQALRRANGNVNVAVENLLNQLGG